jgi:hypothetical protein
MVRGSRKVIPMQRFGFVPKRYRNACPLVFEITLYMYLYNSVGQNPLTTEALCSRLRGEGGLMFD